MQSPIAIFFALEAESGCFEDRLEHAEHLQAATFKMVSGSLYKVDFLVVQTGVGMKNAREITRTICQTHSPRLVISAGFAGGLNPTLRKNDLFFPGEIARDSVETLCVKSTLTQQSLPENSQLGGRLLTVDRVVTRPEAKRELGVKFQAQAVEMESYAVAETTAEMNIPFLSLRVISDAADEVLPQDVQKLVEQKTTASRIGAALGILFQRPSGVKDLFGLYQGSITASARLADALELLAKSGIFRFSSENFQVPQREKKLLTGE